MDLRVCSRGWGAGGAGSQAPRNRRARALGSVRLECSGDRWAGLLESVLQVSAARASVHVFFLCGDSGPGAVCAVSAGPASWVPVLCCGPCGQLVARSVDWRVCAPTEAQLWGRSRPAAPGASDCCLTENRRHSPTSAFSRGQIATRSFGAAVRWRAIVWAVGPGGCPGGVRSCWPHP